MNAEPALHESSEVKVRFVVARQILKALENTPSQYFCSIKMLLQFLKV